MKNQRFWQHPYVDVFKSFKLFDDKNTTARREGSIQTYQDKIIGRTAIKIGGSTPSKNQVQFPAEVNKINYLNQVGRQAYIQMQLPPGKQYSIYLELTNADSKDNTIQRVSLSNIPKSSKTLTHKHQIRFVPAEKWTVLNLDLGDICKKLFGVDNHHLVSIQLCGSAHQKGIYTSDLKWNPETIPREANFKIAKNEDWQGHQDWYVQDSQGLVNLADQVQVERTHKLVEKEDEVEPFTEKTNQVLNMMSKEKEEFGVIKSNLNVKSKVAKGNDKDKDQKNNIINNPSNEKDKVNNENSNSYLISNTVSHKVSSEEIIKNLSEFNNSNVTSSKKSKTTLNKKADEPSFQLNTMNNESIMSMKVEPQAMELRLINGIQTSHENSVKITQPNKIVYSSGPTIIETDTLSSQMRFFQGCRNPIARINVSSNNALLTAVENCKDPRAQIFDMDTGIKLTDFQSEVENVSSIGFNCDNSLLAIVGVDQTGRTKAVVYDIAAVHASTEPKLIAKQLTDFDVSSCKFSPLDTNVLVSCGRENIRFQRIRKGHLPGKPVILNQQARNSQFHCLDQSVRQVAQEGADDTLLQQVLVGSDKGFIFLVDYNTTELRGVFKCHTGPIRGIRCTSAQVATGSDDLMLRVWPQDFKEFQVEAKHASPVRCISISTDGVQIVSATESGSVGSLDIASYEYSTLLRMHNTTIESIDSSQYKEKQIIATSCGSKSIRVQNSDGISQNLNQHSEFSGDEIPLSVCISPDAFSLAVGYESGVVRIFDLSEHTLLKNIKSCDKAILQLLYFNEQIFCISKDTVIIHDVSRDQQPIKVQAFNKPAQFKSLDFIKYEDETLYSVIGEQGSEIVIFDLNYLRLKNRISLPEECKQVRFNKTSSPLSLVCLTVNSNILVQDLRGLDGLLILNLNNILGKSKITCIEFNMTHSLLFLGADSGKIQVCNKAILDLQSNKKVKSLTHIQEYQAHSTSITKMKWINFTLVSTSSSADGYLIWQTKGRNLTQNMNDINGMINKARIEESSITLNNNSNVNISKMDDSNLKTKKNNFIIDNIDESSMNIKSINDARDIQEIQPSNNVVFISSETPSQNEVSYTNQKVKEVKIKNPKSFNRLKVENIFGFNGKYKGMSFDSSTGTLVYINENLVIKEELSTKTQTLFDHSTSQIEMICVNQSQNIIQTASSEDGEILITSSNLKDGKLIKQICISYGLIVDIALDYNNQHLLVVSYEKNNTNVFIQDLNLEQIHSFVLTDEKMTSAIWSMFNNQVFIGVFNDQARMFRISSGNIEQRDLVIPPELSNRPLTYTVAAECVSGFGQDMNEQQIFIGTSIGTIDIQDFQTCNLIRTSDYILHARINQIGVFQSNIVVAGDSNIISLFNFPTHPDQFLQELFNNPPRTLMLDGKVSWAQFNVTGQEGILSTDESSIWYANFEEKASIRVMSPHAKEILHQDSQIKRGLSSLLATCGADNSIRVYNSESQEMLVSFRQSLKPTVVRISRFQTDSVWVGSEGGVLHFLSTRKAKCLQALKPCISTIKSILELDSMTILVISTNGEITLVYTDQDIPQSDHIKIDSEFKTIVFPSLGCEVTHATVSPLEPDYRFLVCTSNGVITTQIRSSDEQGLRKAADSEFTTVDSWDILDNPHGFESKEEVELNRHLYKVTSKALIQAEFGITPDNTLIVATVDILQQVQVRNFAEQVLVMRIPICSFPKQFAVVSDTDIVMQLNEHVFYRLNFESGKQVEVGKNDKSIRQISFQENKENNEQQLNQISGVSYVSMSME